MGMIYDDNSVDKKRQDLKERLLAGQEKEAKNGFKINEYGEIVRSESASSDIASDSDSDSNDMREVIQTLGRFANAVSERQARYDKVWSNVKNTIYAYIGALVAIVLIPSWVSPIYGSGIWLFYATIILIVLQGISTYGKWLSLKDDNENLFFEISTTKFKIYAGIWIVLFLILLLWESISAYYSMGIFCCMLCIIYSYFSNYKTSKYIKENNIL